MRQPPRRSGSRRRCRPRVGRRVGLVGDGPLHGGELLVVAPPLVDVGLDQRRQPGGPLRVRAPEDGEAGLGGRRSRHRDRRRVRVEPERVLALGLGRLEPVQRPVAAPHRVLLVRHRLGHVDAVGDAGAVGDHQRRPGPGVGLQQRLDRLDVVGADRDLGDVDVAVGPGDGPEVLLGGVLAGGGELGDRAAGRRLRRLAAGVRVHLGVEHQDVHVPARRQDVVETAEADVVGPAVAADDPDALADRASPATARRWRASGSSSPSRAATSRATARAGRRSAARSPARRRGSTGPGPSPTTGASRPRSSRASSVWASSPRRMPRPNSALSSNSELFHAGPRPSRVGRVRRGREVGAVDRRAAGGVGHHHPVAEELGDELDVGGLAAARARPRELEQRLEHLGALHRVVARAGRGRAAGSTGRTPSSTRSRSRCSSTGSMLIALCRTSVLLLAGHTSTHTPQPVQSSGATWMVSR